MSAVEFALLAPLLTIGFLFLGLMGLSIYRHLDIQPILRAGAEVALNDPGAAAVKARMDEIAKAKGYKLWVGPQSVGYDELLLLANRACVCPENKDLTIPCARICSAGKAPIVKYGLIATYHEYYQSLLADSLARFRVPMYPNPVYGLESEVTPR